MAKFTKICTADGAFILDVRNRDTIIYTNRVVKILKKKKDFACNGALNGIPVMSTFQTLSRVII